MAANNKKTDVAENETQIQKNFPSPEDFPSYDDVDSDEGQAQLPTDSFDETSANFDKEGCDCE